MCARVWCGVLGRTDVPSRVYSDRVHWDVDQQEVLTLRGTNEGRDEGMNG